MRHFYRNILLVVLLFSSNVIWAADNKMESPKSKNSISVGVMLPLHNVDGDGRRMIEYYRGILMACDQLKLEGFHIDVHAWNVPIDADIKQILLNNYVNKCDLIFGPLYSKQVKPLSEFCKAYNIKLVIPFSITGNDVVNNPNIFQVYQDNLSLNTSAINSYIERFSDSHPVFIDCNDSTSRKSNFTSNLRKVLEAKRIAYNITNIKSSDESFAKAFSRNKHNVVILNSDHYKELSAAIAKLDKMSSLYPGFVVSMFGYTEWLIYANYEFNNFCRYDTYIPTVFYHNQYSAATTSLEKSYRGWFKEEMQPAQPRFAITGYDHAQFFIRGIAKYGNKFVGSKSQNVYSSLQTPLCFEKLGKGGYVNNSFMLIHYLYNHSIESLAY
ncbi:peptidoglycan-binding protein LysM [Prevotella sp.]|uniref:peptidoglycan-binding protein LysM n=1 Tax=Prevotella sp. TaxID=59823 RepID=UPI002649885A|nr:peptidoglycan-binding protein LysM [Prevotella sp.]MDN5554075.1 peptidoglycan-binding protein LysM [Prevotella sp.]